MCVAFASVSMALNTNEPGLQCRVRALGCRAHSFGEGEGAGEGADGTYGGLQKKLRRRGTPRDTGLARGGAGAECMTTKATAKQGVNSV